MASAILRSDIAVKVSVEIMEAFATNAYQQFPKCQKLKEFNSRIPEIDDLLAQDVTVQFKLDKLISE